MSELSYTTTTAETAFLDFRFSAFRKNRERGYLLRTPPLNAQVPEPRVCRGPCLQGHGEGVGRSTLPASSGPRLSPPTSRPAGNA